MNDEGCRTRDDILKSCKLSIGSVPEFRPLLPVLGASERFVVLVESVQNFLRPDWRIGPQSGLLEQGIEFFPSGGLVSLSAGLQIIASLMNRLDLSVTRPR